MLVKGGDELIHFQWTERISSKVVDDIILFPNEADWTKVDTGKSQDRVYLLHVKGSGRRFFYWLQDKNKEKDEENAQEGVKHIPRVLDDCC